MVGGSSEIVVDGAAGLESGERLGLSVVCVPVSPVVSATRCAATADGVVTPFGAVDLAGDDPAPAAALEPCAPAISELACLSSDPEVGVSASTEAAESMPAKSMTAARVREIAEPVSGSLQDLHRSVGSVGMTAMLPTAISNTLV